MVAGVRVSFGLVSDQVAPALEKQNKEYKASRRAINEIEGNYKKLEQAALSAIRKQETEQSKLNRVTAGLNNLVKANLITQAEATEVIRRTRQELDGTAAARRRDERAGQQILAQHQSINDKLREQERILRTTNASEAEINRILGEQRAKLDGTAAARERDRAAGQRIVQQHQSINDTLREEARLLVAAGSSQQRINQIIGERRRQLDGTKAAEDQLRTIGERILQQHRSINEQLQEQERALRAAGVSEERINQILTKERQNLDGTTRAMQERAAAGDRLVRQHRTIEQILSQERAELAAAGASQAEINRIIAARRAQIDGSAAAAERDARAVERIRTAQSRVLESQKAIVREYRRGNITRARALQLVRQINAAERQNVQETFSIGRNVLSTVAGYVSLQQAISLVNRLLERQRELQEGAAEEQVSIGQAQSLALRNTEGFSEEERRQFFQQVDAAAVAIPTASRAEVFRAAAETISATSEGGRGVAGRIEDTVDSIRTAGNLLPDRPEAISELAQAFLGFQKATEGVLTRDEASELLQRTISQSRLTQTENIRNFVPALQNLRTEAERDGGQLTREDVISGAAFLAQLSSGIEDPSGELTRTAGGLFFKTINEQIPDALAKGFDDELRAAQADSALAEGIRRRIVDNLQGRGIAKGTIEQIVRNTGFGAGFSDVRDALTEPQQGADTADLIRTFTPELQASFDTAEARARTTDAASRRFGREGFIRRQLQLAATTQEGLSAEFVDTRFTTSSQTQGPRDAALGIIADFLSNEVQRRAQGDENAAETIDVLRDIRLNILRSTTQPQATAPLPEVD